MGQRESCRQVTGLCERASSQPFTKCQVAHAHCLPGQSGEVSRTGGRVGVERQSRDPQPATDVGGGRVRQLPDEQLAQPADGEPAEPGPHAFGVERMKGMNEKGAAVVAHRDDPGRLRAVDGFETRHLGEIRHREWLLDREELENAPDLWGESTQVLIDQRG